MSAAHRVRGQLAGRSFAFACLRTAVAAVAGAGLAMATVMADVAVGWQVPLNAGRAEALLSALVTAIITLAVFALWMRSVVVGLTASQLSSRLVVSHLEDRFQWRLLVGMAGAISYTAFALLALDTDMDGAPILTVVGSLAVVFGGLIAVLGALREGVRSVSPSRIVRDYADWVLEVIRHDDAPDDPWPPERSVIPEAETLIRTGQHGWVVGVDGEGILDRLPEEAHIAVCVAVGSYISIGDPLAVCDRSLDDATRKSIVDAVEIRSERSPEGDLAFALQHLRDLAEQSLSRQSQDKSTAHEALLYLGTVLTALVQRPEPTGHLLGSQGRAVTSAGRVHLHEHLANVLGPLVVASRDDPVGSSEVGELLERLLEALEDNDHLQHPSEVRDVLLTLHGEVQAAIARSPVSKVLAGKRGRISPRDPEAGIGPGVTTPPSDEEE